MKRPFTDFEVNDLDYPFLESEPLHVRYKPNPPLSNDSSAPHNFDNFSFSHDQFFSQLPSSTELNNHLMIDIENDFDYTCLFMNDDFNNSMHTQSHKVPTPIHHEPLPPLPPLQPLSLSHTNPPYSQSNLKKPNHNIDNAQYTPYYLSNYSKGGQVNTSSINNSLSQPVSSVSTPKNTANPSFYNEKDNLKGEKICWTTEMVNFLIEQYAKNVTRATVIPQGSTDKKNDISFSDLGVPYCGWNSISSSLSEKFKMKISSKACKNKFVKLKLEFSMTNLCEEIKIKIENLTPKEKEKELEKIYQQEPKIKRYMNGNYKFKFYNKMLLLLPINSPSVSSSVSPPSSTSATTTSTAPAEMEEISPCGTLCNLKQNCPNAKPKKKETGSKPPESKGIDDPRLHHIYYHNIYLQKYALETSKKSNSSRKLGNKTLNSNLTSSSIASSTPTPAYSQSLYPSAIKSSVKSVDTILETLNDKLINSKSSNSLSSTLIPSSSLSPTLTSSSDLSIEIHNRISKEISETVSNLMTFMNTSMLKVENLLKERDFLLSNQKKVNSPEILPLSSSNGLDSLINAANLADQ